MTFTIISGGGGGGANGADGVGISTATINSAGQLVLAKTDSSTVNVGVVKGALNPVQLPIWFTDCLGTASSLTTPFIPTAIASGTLGFVTPQVGHPGIVRLTSSTTANSGYRVITDPSSMRMSTGDICEIGFSIVTSSGTTARLGFADTTDQTDVTDGVYAEISGTTLSFKSATGGSRTTATNTATVTVGSFYRSRIEMISSTQCDCTLYDDTGAVVLATQSITTNLPTAVNRQTGIGAVATNSGTTAVGLVDIDYICYSRRLGTELTR